MGVLVGRRKVGHQAISSHKMNKAREIRIKRKAKRAVEEETGEMEIKT
jgi:hypothetical protein